MALSTIASGHHRIISASEVPDEAKRLFWSNNIINIYNTLKLNSVPTEDVQLYARDILKSAVFTNDNRIRIVGAAKSLKVSESQGLPYHFYFEHCQSIW